MTSNQDELAKRGSKIDDMGYKSEVMKHNSESLLQTIAQYKERQDRGTIDEVKEGFKEIKEDLSKIKNSIKSKSTAL